MSILQNIMKNRLKIGPIQQVSVIDMNSVFRLMYGWIFTSQGDSIYHKKMKENISDKLLYDRIGFKRNKAIFSVEKKWYKLF